MGQKRCSFEKNYRLQDIQLSKSSLSYRARSLSQARRVRQTLVFSGRPGIAVDLAASNFAARRQRGGEYRARTGDLLVANQALSQLS
jgi:hypothetical protein